MSYSMQIETREESIDRQRSIHATADAERAKSF